MGDEDVLQGLPPAPPPSGGGAVPPRSEAGPRRRRRRGGRGPRPEGASRSETSPQPGHEQRSAQGPRPPQGPRPQQGAHPPQGPAGRKRGRRGKGRPAQGEQAGAPAAPVVPAAAKALAESHIDASKPVDVPLAPDEAAEMQRHLRFLFKNREVLRLKVNAQEDLLLNGSRPPTHRGACLHLLGKVDLSTTQSALTRLADAKAKAALLAGICRFSSDPGILLLYLETLQDAASRADAAAAFGLAVRRIDFASLSPARMRRVLELITSTFAGHERVQVLFGLLQSESFRSAFDALTDALPPELAGTFVPLRAAHDVILLGEPNRLGADALRDGVRALLDAPVDALRSYPEAVRERLLESAMRWADDPALEDRATDALLQTLPKEGRSFSRLAMLRAQELLRRQRDDEAAELLLQVQQHHPTFKMPGKWLQALQAPRVGRLALWGDAAPRRRATERFRSAFWLDAQRSVWARVGDAASADALLKDALLQRQCAGAGVAPVLECGIAPDGTPYVVLPVLGRPLDGILHGRSLSDEQAVRLALSGCQVLLGLALAGLELPDADPGRFLVGSPESPVVQVGDMSGARRVAPDRAAAAHRDLARAWCGAVEAARQDRQLPFASLDDGTAPALPDLVRALAARA